MNDSHQTIKISEIVIEDRLRDVDRDWVNSLAELIKLEGLKHPITLWRDGSVLKLEAGEHRLEAFKLLEREDIPYTLSQATSEDEARTGEIFENIGREDLSALDKAHALYELKQVYERLHPETRHGGDRKTKRKSLPLDDSSATEIFSFAADIAEKLGVSDRSIRMAVALWNGLSLDSKARIKGTFLETHGSNLRQLAEHKSPVQKKVLDVLLADSPKATNVSDALLLIQVGELPNHVEKKLASIKQTIGGLDDSQFDVVMSAHPEKVEAWLKRTGRG